MLRKNSECMPCAENPVANIEKGSGGVPTSFVQDCRLNSETLCKYSLNIMHDPHLLKE